MTTKPLIRRYDEHIELLIYHGPTGYPIEHYRMNTAPKVLGWIAHLCGKANVTNEHIEAFIEEAKRLGVKVDFHA